jgi:hypothetical protein
MFAHFNTHTQTHTHTHTHTHIIYIRMFTHFNMCRLLPQEQNLGLDPSLPWEDSVNALVSKVLLPAGYEVSFSSFWTTHTNTPMECLCERSASASWLWSIFSLFFHNAHIWVYMKYVGRQAWSVLLHFKAKLGIYRQILCFFPQYTAFIHQKELHIYSKPRFQTSKLYLHNRTKMCRTYTSCFKHIMHKQTNKQIESPANNLNLKYFEFTIKTKIRQTTNSLKLPSCLPYTYCNSGANHSQTINLNVKSWSCLPYTYCNTHANHSQPIEFEVKRLSCFPYTYCNTHANNQIKNEESISCAIHILWHSCKPFSNNQIEGEELILCAIHIL